jgi:anti-anti-sigma factor
MTGMLVEFEFRGDICALRLQGRFATGQDSLYLHTKAEELKNSGYVKILVDFAAVDYVDSTGIGFLIGIYTSVTKSPSGQFALVNTNRRVREVLELTRLAQVIQIYPNEAAAMQALGAGSKSSASQAS